MSLSVAFFREPALDPSFGPFAALRQNLGYVPGIFRAQTLVPRLIEAEAGIAAAVLLTDRALSRIQKEVLLLALAAEHRNTYCVSSHYQMSLLLGLPESQLDRILSDYRQADLSPKYQSLLDFALRLGAGERTVSQADVNRTREAGWNDEALLETILIAALANFLCGLSAGLGVGPDFAPKPLPSSDPIPCAPSSNFAGEGSGPYLRAVDRTPEDFAPFAFFREKFGFVPNIFRAQTLRPDVLEAEADVIRKVLLTEDLLTRVQKENILLVVSAANLNTYCVAVHCEMLRGLGVPEEVSDQIAVDHRHARLSEADKALLDFALKLTGRPREVGPGDIERLRGHGFSEEQALEAVVMISLTNFLNTLQVGLGVVPDFTPRRTFQGAPPKIVHLSPQESRQTEEQVALDPDAAIVARVQGGDIDAFEDLIHRHSQRVYRTLVGILGDPEDARDAMQDTFLKAFQHLAEFQGRAKFSTWLLSIASNTGLQRIRERKHVESLDESSEDEGFRPRQIQAWGDNPEQVYAKAELRNLIEDGVRKLPSKYRVAVVLRDIEHLSTEEAAAALGLGVPALKARLIRGRLMLRESLSAHFGGGAMGVAP